MPGPLDTALTYHQATKHNYHAYARGPGYLDWATQPDPFRRYHGAPVIQLGKTSLEGGPHYDAIWSAGGVSPSPLNHHSVSQLFFDSLAISAWKQAGTSRWALRVNPSSGNLHPTEGYLICGPVAGLCDQPMVCHYAPKEHALEVLTQFPIETWEALTADLPRDCVLVGLTSIHWREAWKYGERAYRYCQHDAGHAIAAVSLAAAGLGWQVPLLDDLSTDQVSCLLGVAGSCGVEAEHADALMVAYPQGQACVASDLPSDVTASFSRLRWQGKPNQLSPDHADSRVPVHWTIIDSVAAACRKPATQETATSFAPRSYDSGVTLSQPSGASLRTILHQRRSAVDMDGRTHLSQDACYRILTRTLAGAVPFNALPWKPLVHLALFVHRVDGLEPGLYLLLREPERKTALQAALRGEFEWAKPDACPASLEFYRLITGNARDVAKQVSCGQDIAGDGCFSLGMIAEFEDPLRRLGPWMYPRLFWECGMIGQVLYLEAEAAGIRGTGIGCYFDDAVHDILGIEGSGFQSLYHFTIGGPVEDTRLTTLPAYE